MHFMAAAHSACGATHSKNDDRVIVGTAVLSGAEEPRTQASLPTIKLEPPLRVAVFDGVGGNPNGNMAALKAVESLASSSGDSLGEALEACSKAVSEWQEGTETTQRALTVGAGIQISIDDEGNPKATTFHVGDARIYRFRNGEVELLTFDHSLAQRFIEEAGPDAEIPPQFAHVVTKYLGGDDPMPFDISEPLDVLAGDIYLACSDGLWEFATTEVLSEAFNNLANPLSADDEPIGNEASSLKFRPGEFELSAKALAQGAKEQGSGDDITLAILACYE